MYIKYRIRWRKPSLYYQKKFKTASTLVEKQREVVEYLGNLLAYNWTLIYVDESTFNLW